MSSNQNETNHLNASNQTITTPIKTVDKNESISYRLTENAEDDILPARYFQKNADGDILEDAEGMFRRVAENVASVEESEPLSEKWAEEYYEQMSTLKFMPNSPTLMNAGTEMNQLSACFVLEPEDDMEDIFETAKDAALIFQSGGGVGYAFSHIRPKGEYINSTGGEASGPVSFMRVFDETCNQVKQGGKRRGAQMAILRVDHPDAGRFAVSKRIEGEFENFNISMGATEDFLDAVRNGESYTLYDPTTEYEEPYEVREATAHFYNYEYRDNPEDAYDSGEGDTVDSNLWRDYADEIRTLNGVSLEDKWAGEIDLTVGEPMELPAEFLWEIMIDGAYQNGEPGLFNFGETNAQHSFDTEEHPEYVQNATNPCAEQPLSEYEACNLGHINLSLMLENDAQTFEEFRQSHFSNPEFVSETEAVSEYIWANIDFDQLNETIEVAVRFLDDVTQASDFPIDEITEQVRDLRKIGLGVMGFAQLLFQMGIPYGSEESYVVAEKLMAHIDEGATWESHKLAEERGTFEGWEESKYANPTEYEAWFWQHTGLEPTEYADGFPMRNHNVSTVAPTGTTSMIANTTGGIEPAYNVANLKNVGTDIQGDDVLVEFDDVFYHTLEENGLNAENIKNEAEKKMRDNTFDGVEDLDVPDEIADIFTTTNDLTPRQHGEMQRVFQSHIDSGISKTVNLPNEATRSDVNDVYQLAIAPESEEVGVPVKGLTVYRDGARDEQVLSTKMDANAETDGEETPETVSEVDDDDEIDGEICEECGEGIIEDTEDCAICPVCFASPCD